MSSTLWLWSLWVGTILQLTSSQSTYDVIEHENDVSSCGRTEEVLNQLMTAVSQLQTAVFQLKSSNSQLQRDVEELKSGITHEDDVTECPANFTNIPSVNGCYKVVTRKLEWSAAGLECRSQHKDAHLLVINDAQEQSAVAEMLAIADTDQGVRSACHFSDVWGRLFWTAGQRVDPTTDSTFVWRVTEADMNSDSVYVMTYTKWLPGEPNHGYDVEACMHMSSGKSYQWNDVPCNDELCSVCELDTHV